MLNSLDLTFIDFTVLKVTKLKFSTLVGIYAYQRPV